MNISKGALRNNTLFTTQLLGSSQKNSHTNWIPVGQQDFGANMVAQLYHLNFFSENKNTYVKFDYHNQFQLNEGRSLQLYLQLLQLRKENLKQFRLVWDSNH